MAIWEATYPNTQCHHPGNSVDNGLATEILPRFNLGEYFKNDGGLTAEKLDRPIDEIAHLVLPWSERRCKAIHLDTWMQLAYDVAEACPSDWESREAIRSAAGTIGWLVNHQTTLTAILPKLRKIIDLKDSNT